MGLDLEKSVTAEFQKFTDDMNLLFEPDSHGQLLRRYWCAGVCQFSIVQFLLYRFVVGRSAMWVPYSGVVGVGASVPLGTVAC